MKEKKEHAESIPRPKEYVPISYDKIVGTTEHDLLMKALETVRGV